MIGAQRANCHNGRSDIRADKVICIGSFAHAKLPFGIPQEATIMNASILSAHTHKCNMLKGTKFNKCSDRSLENET